MNYSDVQIKKWETIISDIRNLSIDLMETEGYRLIIYMSDSEKNSYKTEIAYQIFSVAHEEHLFELWEFKNKSQPKIGNCFEIINSIWFDEYTFIRDSKIDYKHLVIGSIDETIQIITDEYPKIEKINAA